MDRIAWCYYRSSELDSNYLNIDASCFDLCSCQVLFEIDMSDWCMDESSMLLVDVTLAVLNCLNRMLDE